MNKVRVLGSCCRGTLGVRNVGHGFTGDVSTHTSCCKCKESYHARSGSTGSVLVRHGPELKASSRKH